MKVTALLIAVLAAFPAFADEAFTFNCTATSIQANGQISNLIFSEDGASLDGRFFDANKVEAFAHQDIALSTNKYVNGKQAKSLVATVKTSTLKDQYDSYPNNDPENVFSRIYSVEVTAKVNAGAAKTYFGICSQTYIGD